MIHPFLRSLRRVGKLAPAFFLFGTLFPAPSILKAETPATGEDVPPPWAYPVDPPNMAAPKDDGTLRHVPDSTITFTLTQVKDGFVSPDWHPDSHPRLPEIVAHGRKPEVMACGYCHRAEGTGGPENASLAGLPEQYIVQQWKDFNSGARSTALPQRAPQKNMIALSKKAVAPEIEQAAAYFAGLKPKKNIRVIEAEMVPKTEVEGWHLVDLKNGEKEPIGQRIIEFPDDLQQFVSRDSRAQFTAYVPPGSVAKGGTLVTTGGGGRTIQCTICHGPDLKGLGPVPGIAGRSPSYIVRQLYDIKHGIRAGIGSALMKATVQNLTTDDMIALAAYAGSLEP